MITHPQFDPVLISIGPLAVRWYALSYILGFILFTFLGRRRIAQGLSVFTKESLDDFLTWGILGVIFGGRLGYVLFYKFSDYLAHPLDIFKVWEGGMSFHGGFLGVVIAIWLFGRKHGIGFLKLM
ncbi:prolipoprotein diacylglyceryl transferase, partial [Neisseria meningitidis]